MLPRPLCTGPIAAPPAAAEPVLPFIEAGAAAPVPVTVRATGRGRGRGLGGRGSQQVQSATDIATGSPAGPSELAGAGKISNAGTGAAPVVDRPPPPPPPPPPPAWPPAAVTSLADALSVQYRPTMRPTGSRRKLPSRPSVVSQNVHHLFHEPQVACCGRCHAATSALAAIARPRCRILPGLPQSRADVGARVRVSM